jgi:hypothetical protein
MPEPRLACGSIRVVIIASGPVYQDAAALSASTFALVGRLETTVLLPLEEQPTELLAKQKLAAGFEIKKFPLKLVSDRKFTSQLKCQGYFAALHAARNDEILLFADADTVCLRPFLLPIRIKQMLFKGQIALVPDIANNHSKNPDDPWHLPINEQLTYVNSGVLIAAREALPLFERFVELSQQPAFLNGPFNDQKVINFALGKFFRSNLVLMNRRYNSIGRAFPNGTIIGHFAGGAGHLEHQRRRLLHHEACHLILDERSVS